MIEPKVLIIEDSRLPCSKEDVYTIFSGEEVSGFSVAPEGVIQIFCPEYILCSKGFMDAMREKFPHCGVPIN